MVSILEERKGWGGGVDPQCPSPSYVLVPKMKFFLCDQKVTFFPGTKKGPNISRFSAETQMRQREINEIEIDKIIMHF